MSRRRRAEKRIIAPDPRYNDAELARFINRLMIKGKKTIAQRITYSAFEIIQEESSREPLEVFQQALRNATPAVDPRGGGPPQAYRRVHHPGADGTPSGTQRGACHALAHQRGQVP